MRFVRALVYGLSGFLCFYLVPVGTHPSLLLIILLMLAALGLAMAALYQLLEGIWACITATLKLVRTRKEGRVRRRVRLVSQNAANVTNVAAIVPDTSPVETALPVPEQKPAVVHNFR